jgi:hypothetical protein
VCGSGPYTATELLNSKRGLLPAARKCVQQSTGAVQVTIAYPNRNRLRIHQIPLKPNETRRRTWLAQNRRIGLSKGPVRDRHTEVSSQVGWGGELVGQHHLGKRLASECAFGQQGTGQAGP